MTQKKVLKMILWLCFAAVLAFVHIFFMGRVAINSDYASLVLEADDILHGNLFLSHWNGTGVTFITTDLLYYLVGTLIGGVSHRSYAIASGLMYTAALFAGFLCCEPQKRTLGQCALFFLGCSIPCVFALTVFRQHTGAAVWTFCAFWSANLFMRNHNKAALLGVLAAITLGVFGDAETLVIAVAPLFVFCLFYGFFQQKEPKDDIRKSYIWLLVTTLGGVLIGKALDIIYFSIGGLVRNDFLGMRSFVPISQLVDKIMLYLNSMLSIGDAAFFDAKLISIHVLQYFVNAILISLGMVLVLRHCWKFFRGEDDDFISVCLSIGIVLVAGLFILTDIGGHILNARYIAYSWIGYFILIIRDWKLIVSFSLWKEKAISGILVLLIILSFGFRVWDKVKTPPEEPAQKELGFFLTKNGLTNGYASFWNASAVTVLTDNQVKVRPISGDNTHCDYMDWFSKMDWYQNEEAFFVIAAKEDEYGVTPEHAKTWFGEPEYSLEYKGLQILVYGRDISNGLHVNALRDFVLEKGDFFWIEGVDLIDGRLILKNRGILYGPYSPIDQGTYTMTYQGENLTKMAVDVISDETGLLYPELVSLTPEEAVYTVVIPQNVPDIQFRCYNWTEETITIDSLTLKMVE